MRDLFFQIGCASEFQTTRITHVRILLFTRQQVTFQVSQLFVIRRAFSPQIDRSYRPLKLSDPKTLAVIRIVGVRRRDDCTGGHDMIVYRRRRLTDAATCSEVGWNSGFVT
jgi:hypothetical protein